MIGGHRTSEFNMKMELDYTYAKVLAGADLVVTQVHSFTLPTSLMTQLPLIHD
jgi:hypothetical protein